MSETRYFLRTQGRVSGPFTVAQIRALHQRGHFGRFHEVSADKHTWRQASELADLFPGLTPPISSTAGKKSSKPDDDDAPPTPATVTNPPHWQAADWYYQGPDGEPRGPCSLAQLHERIHKGDMSDATLVSKPGMDSWIALADALRSPRGNSGQAATSSSREIATEERREHYGFRLALAAGVVSLVSLLSLFVGLLTPAASVVRAAFLGLTAMLLFVALTADIAAYVCCLRGPRGGSSRQLAGSALILGLCELILRGGMIAFLGFGPAQAAYGPSGTTAGLMTAAMASAASWGRTLLFLLYLCQAAHRRGQPRVVRNLLQSLPILGGVVILGLLFLLAVLISTAADMGGPDRTALDVAWMLGLLGVGAAWTWWFAIYLVALYRLEVAAGEKA